MALIMFIVFTPRETIPDDECNFCDDVLILSHLADHGRSLDACTDDSTTDRSRLGTKRSVDEKKAS